MDLSFDLTPIHAMTIALLAWYPLTKGNNQCDGQAGPQITESAIAISSAKLNFTAEVAQASSLASVDID